MHDGEETKPKDRRRRRCPSCRYDVTMTLADGGDHCPECGHPLHGRAAEVARERALFRGFGGWFVVILVVGMLAIGGILLAAREGVALFAIPLVLFLVGWLPFVLIARMTKDLE